MHIAAHPTSLTKSLFFRYYRTRGIWSYPWNCRPMLQVQSLAACRCCLGGWGPYVKKTQASPWRNWKVRLFTWFIKGYNKLHYTHY